MIFDRIKFTKEFEYHGMREWIGIEGELEPGETMEMAIREARERVVGCFKEVKPNYVEAAINSYGGDELPVIQKRDRDY